MKFRTFLLSGVLLFSNLLPIKISSIAIKDINPQNVTLEKIASGLVQPTVITNASDGTNRIFLVERAGRIFIIANGTLEATPFLDARSFVNAVGGEQGLLGLAFHPDYENNGLFFISYTDENGSIVLAKMSKSAVNPNQADPASRVILATISKKYANHNGGLLAFGPDGYLYWSTGDGGSGGDPDNNAQNLSVLLGKILRLDVDAGSPYSIPPTNPFYGSPDPSIRKEIWAYGLRNPWRFSFDRLTGDLYIGDVGQAQWEEIDYQPSTSSGGENYGWRILEGTHCYNPAVGCVAPANYVPPIAEYNHTVVTPDDYGCSVIGGFVYRGQSHYLPYEGTYFYGDFCSGKLFTLNKDASNVWISQLLLETPFLISTFGEDEQGELYVADYASGTIYRMRYDYLNGWHGSISITSNKNVVAVGRPHVGAEVMAYDGFSSGSLNAYVPMLFKDGFGGSYDSALYVQNVDASNTANITIHFYDSSGNETYSMPDTIAPLASKGYWLPSISALGSSWVGGVKVESDRDIVAVGRPHVGAQVMTYNGFSAGSTTAYVPMLFKDAFGGSYDSALYVENLDTSNTANVTIHFYDSSGNETYLMPDTIAPLASKGYWLPSIAGLGSSWVGGVKVESDRDIVAVGRPHVGAEVMTYNGFASGSSNAYVPMLFKDAFGGSYDSALYVQNVDPSNTANITIRFYDNSGVQTYFMTDTVSPLASKGYWLPSIANLGSSWVGGVKVEADRNIVAVGRPHVGAEVTTYNGFASGSANAYVPMMFKDAFGGSYDSALYIQNLDTNNSANVTLKFYDTDGNLSCTLTDTLPKLSTKGWWLPTLTCSP